MDWDRKGPKTSNREDPLGAVIQIRQAFRQVAIGRVGRLHFGNDVSPVATDLAWNR